MSTTPTLTHRNSETAYKLILASALALLEQSGIDGVTVAAVSKRAGISMRTFFRYYGSREVFLDDLAAEVERALKMPPAPDEAADLERYIEALYASFEAKAALLRSALHTDIFSRMREGPAGDRVKAVRRMIDRLAPHRSAQQRKIAAANVRLYLSATAWHYFRSYFQFTASETVKSAQSAVRLLIDGIKSGVPRDRARTL